MNNPTRFVVALMVMAVLSLAGPLVAAPPSAKWFPQAKPLPEPKGEILRATNPAELARAIKLIKPGGTILLADGHYMLPTYLEITTDNVTLRSASGDRNKVILDGAKSRHGELLGITGCEGVTIANLTVQNVPYNGIKINSDRGAQRVTVHNCVLHNIWQRGVKAPAVKDDKLSPRDCRVQYCLFYNDRPKQYADDKTDTSRTFRGNYIGGIDVKNTIDWKITDNVFVGIHGRTREGRGCIYISENGRRCRIERNIFLNCDIAIALGNPSREASPVHATECIARDNFISHCPETGILACYTRNCRIEANTIHDPRSRRRRLIWVQNDNSGLVVHRNLLVGPDIQVTSKSDITRTENAAHQEISKALVDIQRGRGQSSLAAKYVQAAIQLGREWDKQAEKLAATQSPGASPTPAPPAKPKETEAHRPVELTKDVIAGMRKAHAGFRGQHGYVAQFGDSITYSLAFWSPMGWDDPTRYMKTGDGLPKAPLNRRWRDYVKGARDKGTKFANRSGWRANQLLGSVQSVLDREKPEVAIIMIGTNDIAGGRVPDNYQRDLAVIVNKCLAAHCVPILNTIPPRRGREKAVHEANQIVRAVATRFHVPLVDYHREILRRRPGKTWDGTLMSKDGVHPSGGKTNVYSNENLQESGYALRNWMNFLALRQVYFHVLEPEELILGEPR